MELVGVQAQGLRFRAVEGLGFLRNAEYTLRLCPGSKENRTEQYLTSFFFSLRAPDSSGLLLRTKRRLLNQFLRRASGLLLRSNRQAFETGPTLHTSPAAFCIHAWISHAVAAFKPEESQILHSRTQNLSVAAALANHANRITAAASALSSYIGAM